MGYKFGIAGLGLIADFHAREIEAIPGTKVYSCMSRSAEKAETFSNMKVMEKDQRFF